MTFTVDFKACMVQFVKRTEEADCILNVVLMLALKLKARSQTSIQLYDSCKPESMVPTIH